MLTYAKMMENYLEDHKQFTCQDIMSVTKTTSPHSVVRDLRRKFKITTEWMTKNGKRFYLYTCEGAYEF